MKQKNINILASVVVGVVFGFLMFALVVVVNIAVNQ